MIKTDELRGIIAKNGMSQKTFYEKMKKGIFGSDEIEAMTELLHIDRPWDIFFAKEVTL